ncbi:hypothetical protein OH77DRAFT_1031169 [Trametes cingulata]|nr:hypothetical protein OH77DRAFT_1031169 [Trametes cingulata]
MAQILREDLSLLCSLAVSLCLDPRLSLARSHIHRCQSLKDAFARNARISLNKEPGQVSSRQYGQCEARWHAPRCLYACTCMRALYFRHRHPFRALRPRPRVSMPILVDGFSAGVRERHRANTARTGLEEELDSLEALQRGGALLCRCGTMFSRCMRAGRSCVLSLAATSRPTLRVDGPACAHYAGEFSQVSTLCSPGTIHYAA